MDEGAPAYEGFAISWLQMPRPLMMSPGLGILNPSMSTEAPKPTAESLPHFQPHLGGCRWEGVTVMPYKEDGTHFKSISRQLLYPGGHDLPVELRCFQMQADGYSTLERHHHAHLVMIVQGRGHVMVGGEIREIGMLDVVHIPPMTWHQFRADLGEPMSFACIVNAQRDKPQRPGPEDIAALNEDPAVKDYIRY